MPPHYHKNPRFSIIIYESDDIANFVLDGPLPIILQIVDSEDFPVVPADGFLFGQFR